MLLLDPTTGPILVRRSRRRGPGGLAIGEAGRFASSTAGCYDAPPGATAPATGRTLTHPPLRALLFDLDGTLADTLEDIAAAANAALEDLGRARIPLERVRGYVGRGARRLMRCCLAEDGHTIDEGDLDAALASFVEAYRAHPVSHTKFYDGMLTLIEQAGLPCAVVSNKPGDLCRTILGELGARDRFGAIVGDGDTPDRKPAPTPFSRALELLDVPPANALVIGDGLPDLRGAKAAGIRSCAVTWGYGEEDELLAEEPDVVVASVDELASVLAARSTTA